MRVTNLAEQIDAIAQTVAPVHLATIRLAKALLMIAVASERAGCTERSERMLEGAFGAVQAVTGPDDPRLVPFLEYFADLAQSHDMKVRADALRRRARALRPSPARTFSTQQDESKLAN
jgi:hypothetical protein